MNTQLLVRQLLVGLLFFVGLQQLNAQDLLMQGWYWDYPKTADGFNWADTMQSRVNDIDDIGVTQLWLPPLSRASFGNGSNGYDPKDLYDLGEYGQGATGFGTRAQLDALITQLNTKGIETVADVVYNHRDGGQAEDNSAVEGWIENLNCTKVNAGDNPFPSDRFRCYLPLGGASGNGAGTYYFKIRSASGHPNHYNKEYRLYMETNTVGFQNLPADTESENNGGGDCGQGNNTLQLGVDMTAFIDDIGGCGGFCGIDEFALTIGASDFNAAGDTLWIYMVNPNGNYSDHFIAGIWDGSADIQSQIVYQTYTDFTNLPSGRGGMDHTFFKPNGNPTQLSGDWDQLLFFYDYDQRYQQKTKDSLNVWTKWLWDDVGIRGFRMDAVKHFNYEYVGDLMDYLHDNGIDPGMVVGEFFDTNAGSLKAWVDNVVAEMDADTKAAIDMRVFDFAVREALKNACDAFGYDVRNVFNSGIVDGQGGNAFNVVTFVNNHDYRDAGQPIANDPMLAYAYILTNNQIGLPTVFYPDVFPVTPPNYPATDLQDQIDTLWQIHKDYIFGSISRDYLSRFGTPYSSNYIGGFDNTTLLYQISDGPSGKEIIVAINFAGETLQLDHGINMSNLAVGDTLKDMLGRSNFPYSIINGSNQMYIELPARSYSVWISEPALAPLPVELVAFEAKTQAHAVQLDWRSAMEIAFKGYSIERSLDGQRFNTIGWQDALGNERSYRFLDRQAPANQQLYYRLKMEDEDGSFAYSPVRSVRLDRSSFALAIQPNPTRGQLNLTIELSAAERLEARLLSPQGQALQAWTLDLLAGSHTELIDLASYPPGVYLLQVTGPSGNWIEKIIKR